MRIGPRLRDGCDSPPEPPRPRPREVRTHGRRDAGEDGLAKTLERALPGALGGKRKRRR